MKRSCATVTAWKWSALWGVADLAEIPTKEALLRATAEKEGAEALERFQAASVAVCGLGGLGSNIAITLARAGVGRLILLDFDRVEITNLQRQQYKASQIGRYKAEALAENLREIVPYTILESHAVRLAPENLRTFLGDADVICEAFDNAEAKAMLTNGVLETMPEKYYVAASGVAGLGPANTVRTHRVAERFYLCGDTVSDVADGLGLFPSRVMLSAAHEAHAILRILAGEYDV